MPKPVALYSSITFDAQELTTFLRSLHIEGARILINEKPRPGLPDRAQVIRGMDQYVYISHSNDLLAEGYEKEDLDRIKQVLGSEPKTCIILDIGKYDPGSELLGQEIAIALLDHWPGIVDILRAVENPYLTRDDILDLYKKGYSFLGRPIYPSPKASTLHVTMEKSGENAEAGQAS